MDTKQKTYRMLATVPGSRDGIKVETFNKGQTYDDIPESLAEQFYHQGAIEEVTGHPAKSRETKVTTPAETKEGEAGVDIDTQSIEELVALARDTYGLDVDSTMSLDDVKALIEMAQQDASEADDHSDLTKLTKKQLVAHAKKEHGLELDESDKKDDLIAAIEAKASKA